MDEEHLIIPSGKLEDTLLPRLAGSVFHVTTQQAAIQILADGEIANNKSGQFMFMYPQAKNSYFRLKGCVCLFDLRSKSQEEIQEALTRYYFLNPFSTDKPVFFFLNASFYPNLIPYTEYLNEKAYDTMIIPHVEAGYSGNICLAMISMIIWVEVTRLDEESNSFSARRLLETL